MRILADATAFGDTCLLKRIAMGRGVLVAVAVAVMVAVQVGVTVGVRVGVGVGV